MEWSLRAVLVASLLQVAVLKVGLAQPEWGMECLEWNNITGTLNQNSDMHLSCSPNDQCSGFDCSGSYGYTGYLTTSLFTLNFCYGIQLLQCHDPPALFFYLVFPKDNHEFNDTVYNDTQLQIPHLSYTLSVGQADGFVVVHMEPMTIGFHKFVKLGLTFKMRVHLIGYTTWPRHLQHTLMPDSIVRVPPCYRQQRSDPAAQPIRKCNINITTPDPSMESTTPAWARNGTGKRCVEGKFKECPHNEQCYNSHCVCLVNHYRNGKGDCVNQTPYTTAIPIIDEPFVFPGPGNTSSGPSKHTMTVVISVVVAVVVGAGFLTLFIILLIRYKRHRARYGQHELLVNNDDDPLEIAT